VCNAPSESHEYVNIHCVWDFRWTDSGDRRWFLSRRYRRRRCYCGRWLCRCRLTTTHHNRSRSLLRRVVHRILSTSGIANLQGAQRFTVRQKLEHVVDHILHTAQNTFNNYFHGLTRIDHSLIWLTLSVGRQEEHPTGNQNTPQGGCGHRRQHARLR